MTHQRSSWFGAAFGVAMLLIAGTLYWYGTAPVSAGYSNIVSLDKSTFLSGVQVTPYAAVVGVSNCPLGRGYTYALYYKSTMAPVTITVSTTYDGTTYATPSLGATVVTNGGGDTLLNCAPVFPPLAIGHQFTVTTNTTTTVTMTEVAQ